MTSALAAPIYLAMLRPAYLSQKLDRPLPTKDVGTLRTVLDARTYMLGLSKDRERNARWQRAAGRGRCWRDAKLEVAAS